MAEKPYSVNAIAFIDGQNLYRHAKDAFGHHHPNFDPVKLHKMVCGQFGWNPTLVRFYSGIPSSQHSPMWSGYWSNRVLAMKRAGIAVITRPIRYSSELVELGDGQKRSIVTPHEKGIDVRIALDIVRLARTRQFDAAIIFSQDSDLEEVVHEVRQISIEQDRWIKLACAFPVGPNATSKRGIGETDWVRINEADYNRCLDPKDYRPKKMRG